MAENKQIIEKIKRYKEIIKQTKRLRREKNEILSWLDRNTRGEEYYERDIQNNIDKIEEKVKGR